VNADAVHVAMWRSEEWEILFTLEQIDRIHAEYGKAATLAEYLRALREIGVTRYDSFLCDGHSEYFDGDGRMVTGPAAHAELAVAAAPNQEEFLRHLRLHGEGKTSYVEMSTGVAESGVGKWTFDTEALTITYYDGSGNVMPREEIR
jgi:uncharacterized protein YbcV (DUF1398 family)